MRRSCGSHDSEDSSPWLGLGVAVALGLLLATTDVQARSVRLFAGGMVIFAVGTVLRVATSGVFPVAALFEVFQASGQSLAHVLGASAFVARCPRRGGALAAAAWVVVPPGIGLVTRALPWDRLGGPVVVAFGLPPKRCFIYLRSAESVAITVLDFGIAKKRAEPGLASTSPDLVMGTALYMAPEQARASANVDARADVWALGVVLFELLTQELPFPGTTTIEVVAGVLGKPMPKLASVFGELPEGLVAVIERCLSKRAEERFANAAELSRALAPFREPLAIDRPRIRVVSPYRTKSDTMLAATKAPTRCPKAS